MRFLTPIVARLALASLLLSGVAAASPEPPKPATNWLRKPTPKPAPVETKPAMSPLRVTAMLSLVALLGGVAFYAKRRRTAGTSVLVKERLAVISSTRVGPKAHAVVISVAGRQMLLGVTDSSVKRLAFIDELEDEEVERAPARRERAQLPARGSALGLGNDLGGSIRVPCHFCGIHGFKSTSFRLPRGGSMRTLRGFEAIVTQPGPMARHVAHPAAEARPGDLDGLARPARGLHGAAQPAPGLLARPLTVESGLMTVESGDKSRLDRHNSRLNVGGAAGWSRRRGASA